MRVASTAVLLAFRPIDSMQGGLTSAGTRAFHPSLHRNLPKILLNFLNKVVLKTEYSAHGRISHVGWGQGPDWLTHPMQKVTL
jgi:hypothetical protein